MLKRRGSIKLAKGVRLNYGKRGLTSVNIGGVRLGSARRSGGSRRQSKAEVLAQHWRLKPGVHFVRIELDSNEWIDLVVDGGELTFARMDRIKDGLYSGDTATVARAFSTFVKSWDILGDDGKRLPINKASVDQIGIELIFGMTVEVANALKIPAKPLGNVLKQRSSGSPVRVVVSDRPFSSSTLPIAPSLFAPSTEPQTIPSMDRQVRKQKSTTKAYLIWLPLGLIGGHRYYLGRPKSGFLMTITLGGVGVWWLIDAFRIPSMVNSEREG